MHSTIGIKVREARIIRGFTQQNLADHLGKTPQAISEIERGNTQISAIDLHKLAELLSMPIEVFYYDTDLDQEVNVILSLIRKLPPDVMKLQLTLIKSILEFEVKQSKFKSLDFEETDDIEQYVSDFYGHLVRFVRNLDSIREKIIETKTQIEDALGLSQ